MTLGLYALTGTVLYGGLTIGSFRIAGVALAPAARIIARQCLLGVIGVLPVALVKYVFRWSSPAILSSCGLVLLVHAAALLRWLRPAGFRSFWGK